MYKKRLVSYVVALVMIFSTFVYTNASAVGDDATIDQTEIQQSESVGENTQENIETEDAVENAATEDAADAAGEEQTNTEPAAPAEETDADETAAMPEDGEAEDSEPAGEDEPSNEDETAAESPVETAAPTPDSEQGEVSDAEVSEDGLEEELEATSAYYDLSDEEKAELLEVYTLNESVVLDCADAGFSVQQIIDIAPLIQFAGITAQQYISMSAFYENQEDLQTQLKTFGNYTYKYPSLGIENDEICKTLLSEGYSADSILTAYLIIRELGGGDIRNYLDIDDIFSVTELSEEQIINILSLIGSDIETLATAEDYYDQSKYPMAPFDYKSRGNETINTSTGAVGYNTNNISLPGANGLNLNIGARYDSTYSSGGYIYSIGSDLEPRMWFDRSYTPLMEFAVGWSFNFSYIKVIDVGWLYTESQAITSDGARYTMYKNDIEDASKTEITLNYRSNAPKQHSMFKDKSYSYGGLTSAYRLEYKDGTKEYFDKDGILMKTENRFGDKITYKYEKTGTEQSYGSVDHASIYEKYNKVTITDTCGRETVIERTARKSEAVVSSEYYTGEYHEIIITLPSADTDTEASTLTYKIKTVKNDNDPKNEGHYLYFQILDSITERDGSKTTFKYMQNQSLAFSYDPFSTNPNVRENYQHYYPITEIIYPTGGKTTYSYEIDSGFLGMHYNSDTNQYFRVTNRKDISETGAEYNNISYSYYSNYLLHGDYSVTETNSDGVSIEYYYTRSDETSDDMSRPASSGGFRVKTSETTYLGGDKDNTLNKVEYGSYYKRTYPSSVKTTVYNDEGDSVSTTQLYKYNEYGDLMESWSAKAEGDETNVEYKTTYTYDDTYHLPLTTENKRDSSTTLKTENILTSNGKAVSETRKYENNNLVSKTTYTYANANSQNPTVTTQYANVNSNETLVTNYEYQNNALITKQTTGSSVTQYEYDGMGRLIKTIDPNGNATQTVYDCMDRAVETINPDGSEVANEYPVPNADGTISANKITTTDGNGNKMEYNYDKLGLLENIKESGATYNLVSYDYDSMGRIISLTDGNGNVYNYTYDERSRKTNLTVKNPSNSVVYTESYDYNEVDGDDNSVVTTTVGSGDDSMVSAQYTNKYGELVKETSGTGEDISTTKYTYDYVGNVVYTITPNAAEDNKQYTYRNTNTSQNNAGTTLVVTDIYNNTTSEKKDMLERTVKTTDALGNETNTTYDAMGRVSTVSGKIDGGDSVTAYTYDGNGNVIKESVTSNKPGETTAYRNTYYQYDSMNRLIKTNTDEPGETLYEYDDNGNVTKMTTGAVNGAGGVSTTYEYDSQNRLVKTTDPMGYTETYTYDNNGNVASMTDKNGTVTTNTYNAVNNLLNSASVKDTTTQTTTYTYGAASGVLLGISDDNSSISYSYNKKGQQTGESRSTGETLTYTYDKDGNQTGMTMSANNGGISQNLSYTYNYLGQMTEVKDNAANEVIAAYTYDGNGNITEKKTNGNSMITEYTYNESGLIKTVENRTVADPQNDIKGTYSKYSYNYYLDGNQSDMTDVFNKTKTYTYDGAGRLKTETYVVADGDTIETTYEYDERGNRLSKEQLAQQDDPYGISLMEYDPRPQYGYGEGETVYTYDANNRMITSKYNYDNYMNEDHTYTYDNNGNLKSDYSIVFYDDFAPADGTHIVYHEGTENYTYDNLNRLKRYSGEIYADYAYDPTGMRISKKLENENQINYVWSGGNIIGEYGIDGSKTYLRGAGGEIVKTKDGNSEERYFAYNAHGDTTSIVEKAPESVSFGVTATYEYDAFGNLIEGSETGETHENSFRYNGQQVDEESGLIYLRNRYYNPEIGRFITEDPYWNVNNMIYGEDGNNGVPSYASIAQSSNLYVYCMSEPVNFADPLGLTLTLIGSADEVWERYQSILLLTDDSLKLEQIGGADSNVYGVYILEYGVGERPVGTSLVRRIIKNEVYDCRIQTAYGDRRTRTESVDQNGAYMWYDENNVPHSSYGSDANIYIGELPTVPVDGGGYDIPEQMSLQITIGHEMIHALRMMNGNFKDPNYYINRNTGIPYEEYEVTGISYYDSNGNYVDCAYWVTTENALRREQRRIGQPGHLLRTGYTAW